MDILYFSSHRRETSRRKMKISTQDLECCFVIIKNDAVDIPHSRFQGRVLRRQRHCLRCWATTFGGVATVDCDDDGDTVLFSVLPWPGSQMNTGNIKQHGEIIDIQKSRQKVWEMMRKYSKSGSNVLIVGTMQHYSSRENIFWRKLLEHCFCLTNWNSWRSTLLILE